MFATDLEELMLDAEKKCFGNGMDHDWLHPFRWITKVHYYIPVSYTHLDVYKRQE